MSNQLVHVMGATKVAVGLSAIVKIGQMSFQHQLQWKYVSGGSLEIVEPPVALSGSSASGWGTGYLVGTSEKFDMLAAKGPACYYLAATAATVVIHCLIGKTSGATII